MCLSPSLNNINGIKQEQTFVTQTFDPGDLRCGAFSMAFYKWLNYEGKTYSSDQTADYSIVDNIYTQITFGSAYSNIGEYNLSATGNPLKMLDYACTVLGNTSAEFYRDNTIPEMEGIHTAITFLDSDLFAGYAAKDKTGGIPALGTGQYAIVVFSVALVNDTFEALHWILFHKTASGYELYDPYLGKAIPANENQLKGREPIFVTYPVGDRKLLSMNSCLYLP